MQIGVNGFCDDQAIIINSLKDIEKIPEEFYAIPMILVAQTTYSVIEYHQIIKYLTAKSQNIEVYETICASTGDRQQEAARLAAECDQMVVIGGKHSSNTRALFEICKKICQNTVIVEGKADVSVEKFDFDGIIGVIAGASTPQWSIREVISSMNEQNLSTPIGEVVQPVEEEVTSQAVVEAVVEEQNAEPTAEQAEERELTAEESFERDLEKSLVRIRPGQVKKGTIVQIVGDDVFVNIGYKADGIIPQSEPSLDPKASASELFAVGDEVNVEIVKVNDGEGNVLLSKKAVDRREADRQAIADLEDGRHFEVTIRQAVKSGVLSEYRGARVFIPASQLDNKYVENLEEFVGKKIAVKAIEVDKSRRRLVASRRVVLREEAEAARKAKYLAFEAGQRVKGIVRRITDFGAFTDIGGVDGLIHVTDLSWGRVKHPSDVVKVGDEVEVEILSVDAEKERIALGYKQLQPKPWDNAAERYLVGDIVEGVVARIAPFGSFVELEPGLFGLVHISQIATRRIEKVEDELQIGDVITVKVMEVNTEAKRISLSRRAVLQEENPRRNYQPVQQENDEEEEYSSRFEIPPVEEAKVSLADFFPDEYK